MAFGGIRSHDWLNRNSLRSYPIVDGVNLLASDGTGIPRGILVDALLWVARGSEVIPYVKSMSFTRMTVTVVIADAESGDTLCYATAVIGVTPENGSVSVESPDGGASGHLVFGPELSAKTRADFSDLLGTHTFPVGARLESRCFLLTGKPMVKQLKVSLQDFELSGDVTLLSGVDGVLEVSEDEVAGDQVERVIEFRLKTPEAFLPDCYPTNSNLDCFCDGDPIETINGIPGSPGDYGVDIVFGNGLSGVVTAEQPEYLVALLVEGEYKDICLESPVIPDSFGRLGPEFSNDCPPRIGYGLSDKGPPCWNRAPRVPHNSCNE